MPERRHTSDKVWPALHRASEAGHRQPRRHVGVHKGLLDRAGLGLLHSASGDGTRPGHALDAFTNDNSPVHDEDKRLRPICTRTTAQRATREGATLAAAALCCPRAPFDLRCPAVPIDHLGRPGGTRNDLG